MNSQTRKLRSGRPMMLGGNVFGWTVDDPTSFAILDHYLDRGFTKVDTADAYFQFAPGMAGAESETVIGKWLKQGGRRDRIVLSTKVGLWNKRPGLSAANIVAAFEDSLRRLNTDYIDIYFAHTFDDKVPVAETMAAFDKLMDQGKIGAIGVSNWTPAQIADAMADGARISALQPLYNLVDRKGFETELRDTALRFDIDVLPWYGLASGFLSGRYRKPEDAEGKARSGNLLRYMTPRGLRILDALDAVAGEIGSTPARVAIAWLIRQPAVTAPLVSATSIAQLDDILGAVDLVLSDEALALLNAASAESD